MSKRINRREFIQKASALGLVGSATSRVFGGVERAFAGDAGGSEDHRVYLSFAEPVVDPSHELYVTWLSNSNEHTALEYRVSGAQDWIPMVSDWTRPFPALSGFYFHTVTLTQLNADTTYEYRVLGANFTDRVKTCPAHVPLNVLWAADWQMHDYSPAGYLWRLGDVVSQSADTDLMWLGGDYVSDDGRVTERFSERWLNFLTVLTQRYRTRDGALFPLLATIGNHEGRNRAGTANARSRGTGTVGQIADIFSWSYRPEHPSRFHNSAATMRVGNAVLFIGLETDHTEPLAGQFDFFSNALQQHAPNVLHSFIGGHVPPFNNWSTNFVRAGDRMMRNQFWPEAAKHSGPGKSLRAWMVGHTHAVVVTPKLEIDYQESLSLEDNDNRWFASPNGFHQLGNGPLGYAANQNVDTINRVSPIDGSHYWSAILRGIKEEPEIYHVHGTGIINAGRPLAHVWKLKLTEQDWTAEAVNLDGEIFYTMSENILA